MIGLYQAFLSLFPRSLAWAVYGAFSFSFVVRLEEKAGTDLEQISYTCPGLQGPWPPIDRDVRRRLVKAQDLVAANICGILKKNSAFRGGL